MKTKFFVQYFYMDFFVLKLFESKINLVTIGLEKPIFLFSAY